MYVRTSLHPKTLEAATSLLCGIVSDLQNRKANEFCGCHPRSVSLTPQRNTSSLARSSLPQITGRNLRRDPRYRGRFDSHAEPAPSWPRGIVIAPPPSPKPWKGWTMSNESWRTTASNATIKSCSSQELVAEWDGVGSGGGLPGDRAGSGDGMGVAGGGGGGGVALGNGVSGGGNAGGGVLDNTINIDATAIGNGGQRARESSANGGVVRADGSVLHAVLPPLAPVPRQRAFPQQSRLHTSGGSGGDSHKEERTVSFAPIPVEAIPAPSSAASEAARPIPAQPIGDKVSKTEEGAAALRDGAALPGGKSVVADELFPQGVGQPSVQNRSGELAIDEPAAGQQLEYDGKGNVGKATPPGVGGDSKGVVVGDRPGVNSVTVKISSTGEKADPETMSGSSGGLALAECCGTVALAKGGASDFKAVKQCAPEKKITPTKLAIRQWRHSFLP